MNGRFFRPAVFLALTLAYLLTGLLTGLLASKTGLQDQIMWIPAGIALAAGIHFGYRILPAAALGSLLLNLGQTSNWSLALTLPILLSSLLMAGSVWLQAVAGTWLVLNKTGNPLTAYQEGQILRFILLVGCTTPIINASIGTLALNFVNPALGGAGWLQDWLGWWLGDSFSIILITPLTLALLNLRDLNHSRLKRLIKLFASVLAAALLTHQVYLLQLNRQLDQGFLRDVDVFHANLNRLYNQSLADLAQLERQYAENNGLTAAEFRKTAEQLLKLNPSIRAYAWDPIVQATERNAFENRTSQLLGNLTYRIYGDSPAPDDPMVVVQYIEPLQQNKAALGLNLLSIEDRRRGVIQAQETGRPAATQLFYLAQAQDEPGLLILQPVYLNSQPAGNGLLNTEKRLVGFMAGIFTVGQMIEAALSLSELHGIRVELQENQTAKPFYGFLSDNRLLTSFKPRYQQTFPFEFGQQIWQIKIAAGSTYLALSGGNQLLPLQALLVLAGVLSSAVILGMHSRESTLAHRVHEQTRNLTFQAHHDPLTGLPNRLKLEQDMEQCLHHPENSNLALMFIDLDRFKLINDSLGHLTGDYLLVELAARWQLLLDDAASLYRMGGDEFILLLQLQHPEQQAPALDMARRLLECAEQPLLVDGLQLQVTASIGLTFSPQQGRDFNSLIRNADTALHQAKAGGKNRFELYQASQTDATLLNFELEQDLRMAINTSQILLHYQPQFKLQDQSLCGLEALVRWQHPQRGMIPPDQFIGLAEETLLILPLGWQIIKLACQQVASWLKAGIEIPCVAINISPRQLLQCDFISKLNQIVDHHGVGRHHLEIEITETLLNQDPDFALQQLKSLQQAGYRLALDDFGTGYSSFNRLKYMPLSRIKIDRSFVQDIGRSSKDEAIIHSIIGLGRSLDIEVLAEGVETQEQQDFLQQQGCDSVQGYLRGRPVAHPLPYPAS